MVQTAHLVVCPPEGFQIVSIQLFCFVLFFHYFCIILYLLQCLLSVLQFSYLTPNLIHICHRNSVISLQGSIASYLIIFHLVFIIVLEMHSWFIGSICETLIRHQQCSYSLLLLGIFHMKVLLNIPLITAQKCSIIQE